MIHETARRGIKPAMSGLEFTSFLFPKSPYTTACYRNGDSAPDTPHAQYLEFSHPPACPRDLRDLATQHRRITLIGCGPIHLPKQRATPWRSIGDCLHDPHHAISPIWTICDISLFALRMNAIPGADMGQSILGYRILCSAQSHRRALMLPFADQIDDWNAIDIPSSTITEYSSVPTPADHRMTDGQPDLCLADIAPAQITPRANPARKRA